MEQKIKEYINSIDEYTINKYAKINDINLNEEETKIIYMYIKNYWETFLKGEPTELFKELEEQIDKNKICKIKELYYKYKKKIIH